MKLFRTVLLLLILLNTNNIDAKVFILVSKYDIEKPIVPNHPNEEFQFIFSNLIEAHEYILNNLCHSNTSEIKKDIIIYIKSGVYFQNQLIWKATSSDYSINILAYPQDRVIFDGRLPKGKLALNFIELSNKNGRTNLHIEGLIIQNYVNGIWLGNTIRDEEGNYFKGIQNSHNIIKNNIFRNLGNKYSTVYQAGYSALGINNSNSNLIEGNIFCDNENNKLNEKNIESNSLMHSIYVAHYSTENTIKKNYISNCSGDPIRIRNASHNNRIQENQIFISGTTGFITEWYRTPEEYPNSPEEPSLNTLIGKNICAYSYPNTKQDTIYLYRSNVNNGALNENYIDIGDNMVIGGQF